MKDDAVDAMTRLIFPYADVLTPNIPEAELFTGVKILDREDVFKAARLLLDMGPQAVLIKGGHSDQIAVTDWFVEKGREPVPFMQQRVNTDCTHGTGCTLSAAIATGLGCGLEIGAAILRAQEYLNMALRAGYRLGEGGGPPNHVAPWVKEKARPGVLVELEQFSRWLTGKPELHPVLPRGRSNVAVSLPFANSLIEVAGFVGGVVGTRSGNVMVAGRPEFDASTYTASVLLAVRRLNSEMNCAMTLALTSDVRKAIELAELPLVWIDRDRQPEYIIDEGGRLEEWGTFESVKNHIAPESVRAVADPGGVGREPLVRILAEDVTTLREFLEHIIANLKAINEGI